MRVYSPGKINLHLRVGPVRPDGFHPLCSWMATVGLFDTLDFTLQETPGLVTLTCDAPPGIEVPTDKRNLVVRAAELLRNETTQTLPGVAVHLTKVIPTGGGLGGGSGNAAVALRTLDRLWRLDLPEDRLMSLAATLGSDVPFFLSSGSAWCRGRGEILAPASPPTPGWAVLVFPPMTSPTAGVYRQFDAIGAPADWDTAIDAADWSSLPAEPLLSRLVNDLEPPAFSLYPVLSEVRQAVEHRWHRPVRMSGSGSTLFSLFDTAGEADAAAKVAEDAGFVSRAVTLVTLVPE